LAGTIDVLRSGGADAFFFGVGVGGRKSTTIILKSGTIQFTRIKKLRKKYLIPIPLEKGVFVLVLLKPCKYYNIYF